MKQCVDKQEPDVSARRRAAPRRFFSGNVRREKYLSVRAVEREGEDIRRICFFAVRAVERLCAARTHKYQRKDIRCPEDIVFHFFQLCMGGESRVSPGRMGDGEVRRG